MDLAAWTQWAGASDYDVARFVLQRGVAAIACLAFLSALAQFPALKNIKNKNKKKHNHKPLRKIQ